MKLRAIKKYWWVLPALIISSLLLSNNVFATPVVVVIGGNTTYTYNQAADTFNLSQAVNASILVVGGGGGGGAGGLNAGSGGGGAGGYNLTNMVLNAGTYIITVGTGGAGGAGTQGANGSDSLFSTLITSVGGGGGGVGSVGVPTRDGKNGGSGGGAAGGGVSGGAHGNSTPGQGYNGGDSGAGGGGGGGGGANSSAVATGASAQGANGGTGNFTSVNGTLVCYAGGGAGSSNSVNGGGNATCGAGNGPINSALTSGFNATDGTGSGGGGGGFGAGLLGGNGGRGIIIITFNTPVVNNFTINVTDQYDGTVVSTFNASVSFQNGTITNYTTTTGQINTTYILNGSQVANVTLTAANYFNKTYTNTNLSSVLLATMFQAQAQFNTTEIISNLNITGFTVTAPNGINSNGTPIYFKAGTYLLTWNKTLWYSTSFTVVVPALSNATYNLSGVFQYLLNITAVNNVTGIREGAFTITGKSGLYPSYLTSISTTNGTVFMPWINDTNLNLTLSNATNISTATLIYNTSNFTGVPKLINITITSFTTNTIMFSIYEENTQLPITTANVSIFLTGTTTSYNYSTATSLVNTTVIVPDTYVITFTATGYNQRQIIYTLTNQTTRNIGLFLLASGNSTTIETFYQDQNLQRIPGANVTLSRKNLSGTNYYDVYGCAADTNGRCLINAQIITATYKICYSFGLFSACSGDLQFSSNDATNGRTFILSTTNSGNNFYVWNSLGQSASISFLPNSTAPNGTVRFSLQNSGLVATQACLNIYRVTGNTNVLDSSNCVTPSSVLSLDSFANLSTGGDSILANGYVTVGGIQYLIAQNSLVITTTGLPTSGKRLTLLVVVTAVILTLIFSYSWNPIAPPVIAGFVLYVFWSVGLIVMTYTTVMLLLCIPILVWLLVGRKS